MSDYWIGVASLDHVSVGVDGGFSQLSHGKQQPLSRMKKGDWIVYYSPKETFEGETPLRKFTAIGEIVDDEIYQYEMAPGFIPWRRNVAFLPDITPVDIHELIDELEFIEKKQNYGAKFRFGHIKINEHDFMLIASKMGVAAQIF